MIRIKVWHNTPIGGLVYPDGYYDEYIFNAEIREDAPNIERTVSNSDGRDIIQQVITTSRKSFYLFIEEIMRPYIDIIPMYSNIEIYDESNNINYTDIYNITLVDDDSYNNGTVKSMKLTFSYRNFITRNSV